MKSLFSLLLLGISSLAAQPAEGDFSNFKPRFEIFKLPGGGPANKILCIEQDHLGFLWFGSEEGGLHCYDGQRVITYQHDPLDSNSLASNQVEWIYIDKKG